MSMHAADLASGKGHKDENFPVASFLIAKRFRPAIMAFYRFVRIADDVADHETAEPEEKLRLLEEMRLSLTGGADASPEGVALRQALAAGGVSTDHAADLLEAFRRDCVKPRTADWNELMDYCRYSAMPVGRFVLDVHGESRDLWPLNDALCAALQIVNHLQDCAKDYTKLDRIYLPLDAMAAHGVVPEMLGRPQASLPLLALIRDVAGRNDELLKRSAAFHRHIKNARLALEVSVIQTFAEDLTLKLGHRDPLCQRVHHRKRELAWLAVKAFWRFLGGRIGAKTRP